MPATIEEIQSILNSARWTDDEKWVVEWQFRLLGSFGRALAHTLVAADETNLERLSMGFPMEVLGFRKWAYGDLGNRLRKAGLGI